ncbi:MAG: DUF4340 domain-containing protein [Pseudomonas sp.]|nr:DUF4340 domain-containing protein [Pseudomonas sp.]
MKIKLLAVLAVISVLLIGIALQRQNDDRVEDLQSRPLLSEQQLEQLAEVERIRLSKGDDNVELVLEGGRWGVVARDLFPAQPERIAALLHAVRGARVIEKQTDNPQYHARLGLDPEQADAAVETLPLRVQLGSDEQETALLFGNPVGSGQLVRFADENQVWLINRPFGMTLEPREWLDLKVVRIPMEFAATARWEHADGEVLELDKAAEGDYNFRLVGLEQDQQQGNERWTNSMVLALTGLNAQDAALRSDLELDEPELRMLVTTWQGAELEASLYDLDGRYWLTIDRFEQPADGNLAVHADPRWAFQLGVAQVEDLLKRRTDIIRNESE